ncbi:MAG: orotidine-5'-phosphate decarboxylase [Deltaproteobacteria bacterium]|nr:orotidine-5'-phosphate decarboxylase [Deltaproteobacteria bacterium]
MLKPQDRLIFALDVPDQAAALNLARSLRDEVGMFKVGLELYLAAGPSLLQALIAEVPLSPGQIFLDLKLYDIPATVLGALRTTLPGLAFLTLPSDLGPTGLQKVVAGAGAISFIKFLAVTILTSVTNTDLQALGYDRKFAADPTQLVLLRAQMAQQAGCHGVVCSGREVKQVKELCGPDFVTVCPGIRPAWATVAGDDQQRIVTPLAAIQNGADYIVVGRPIRQAQDPAAAARQVVAEIAAGMK